MAFRLTFLQGEGLSSNNHHKPKRKYRCIVVIFSN